MRVLLDTHAFLWAAAGHPSLGKRARRVYLDPGNRVHLSTASVWEMAIKASLDKLKLTVPLEDLVVEALEEQSVALLPIELDHVLRVQSLPFHHRDPFDRLLAAQALCEEIAILSSDSVFDAYGVDRVW
jgi:PIN domain nuclease of toxin-antitoxin system